MPFGTVLKLLNPATFSPALIIFDKDGTLIDFKTMWGGWATELGRRLEIAAGQPIASQFFKALDYDPVTGRIAPDGNLAVTPIARLRALTIDLLCTAGFTADGAETATLAAWFTPDPVALAEPIADLRALFSALRAYGLKIAIATSDDRASTEATLAALGLTGSVDAFICADDGLPIKPAPDMVLSICRTLGIAPAKTIMVGDNVADLQMGRAAGVGMVIGVLSGVSSATVLRPEADILLSSVNELIHS